MIRLCLGNPGSGKTATEVWRMQQDPLRRYYTNIQTYGLKHVRLLEQSMLFNRIPVRTIQHRNGEAQQVYDLALNTDFWKAVKKPVSVVLDEAHTILNARRSMAKLNVIMTDWLALIRRVLGTVHAAEAELVLITQLSNRIDSIARDMATRVEYHRMHYMKSCKECGMGWAEHNDMPEPPICCRSCGSRSLTAYGHAVEVWAFTDIDQYARWVESQYREKTFYRRYLITDIQKAFGKYETLQWDLLLSAYDT